jgi:hypothetical protein
MTKPLPKPVVKKKIVKKEKQSPAVSPPILPKKIDIKKDDVPTNNLPTRPETLSFYGHTIRNTFMNNQWYFSLEDLLRVANIVDPTKFLINLKNTDNLKDRYYSLVETFSYYEGDSPIIIPIVNYQNFMELLPSIRAMDFFMPGPLPDWLKNMANRSL